MVKNRTRSGLKGSDDLEQALHEEVDRLPERYRLPVVLCDLEGHSYEEAARHLGCPVGTVRSRLAHGRERLRGRLVHRGVAPSTGLAELAFVSNAVPRNVPAALLKSTIQAVACSQAGEMLTPGAVSASVTAIAEGVLRAMLLTKIKTMVALTLAASVTVVGLGLLARGAAHDPPPGAQESGQTKVEITVTPPAPATKPASAVRDKPVPATPVFQAPPPIVAFGNVSQTKIWVHNPNNKTWHTYQAPKGVLILVYQLSTPSRDFIALSSHG